MAHDTREILLGSGVPFFRNASRRSELKLEEARPIAGGCVILRYSVRAAARKRRIMARVMGMAPALAGSKWHRQVPGASPWTGRRGRACSKIGQVCLRPGQ